jgi:hypothetical protein
MDLSTFQDRADKARLALQATNAWWPDSPVVPAIRFLVNSIDWLVTTGIPSIAQRLDGLEGTDTNQNARMDAIEARLTALETPVPPVTPIV